MPIAGESVCAGVNSMSFEIVRIQEVLACIGTDGSVDDAVGDGLNAQIGCHKQDCSQYIDVARNVYLGTKQSPRGGASVCLGVDGLS